jgi:hypothetical protein
MTTSKPVISLLNMESRIETGTLSDRDVERSYQQTVAYPGILFGGGGSTNSVEDRENGDLGTVAPSQVFWRQL